jgi:hypothetical protein
MPAASNEIVVNTGPLIALAACDQIIREAIELYLESDEPTEQSENAVVEEVVV